MLPIAYFSFLLLMNSQRALGDATPTGGKRLLWNALMIVATLAASFGSAWGLYGKSMFGFPIGNVALAALAVMFVLGTVGFMNKQAEHKTAMKSATP